MGQKNEEAIKNFKTFVRNHPELIKGVNKQGKSWKDVFDEWVLFGEDHEIWESYGMENEPKKKPPGAMEFMRVLDFLGNLDSKTVQDKLEQFNGALNSIQELIQLWQPQQRGNTPQMPSQTIPFQEAGQTFYNTPYPQMTDYPRRD